MYEANLDKLKLVLQNLEKATEHLRDFIETAEMPEAIITLLGEQGPQKQDFLASALGVGIREINGVIQHLKKNNRIITKGKIGTSNCLITSKEVPKKMEKKEVIKVVPEKDDFLGDLKKLEAILSTAKEKY